VGKAEALSTDVRRRAVSGGQRLRTVEEPPLAVVASQPVRAVEDGERAVGIVMDADPGLDEVGTQGGFPAAAS
jgi:hypothetical protein